MGRYKTISDDEVLNIAREIFREKGHTATTREIAQAAGISEAVLYQRFASKDELFLAAMAPRAPDVDKLLGPKDPPEDAHAYLRTVVARLGEYFSDIIPLAVRVMTHPGLGPAALARSQSPRPSTVILEGLTERLTSLAARKRIVTPSTAGTARLLVSMAHDWGLGIVFGAVPSPRRDRELREMVDVVWEGLRTHKT
jgi:AcrR family transcriptional regulator